MYPKIVINHLKSSFIC